MVVTVNDKTETMREKKKMMVTMYYRLKPLLPRTLPIYVISSPKQTLYVTIAHPLHVFLISPPIHT